MADRVASIASIAFRLGLVLLCCVPSPAQARQHVTNVTVAATPNDTLLVNCRDNDNLQRVLSPVAVSQDAKWRAYVEVEIRNAGCLHTTRLWPGQEGAYHQIYMISPDRENAENGAAMLGWAQGSRLLLLQTEQWQYGSDVPDRQRVLAIDVGTGEVYEPDLQALLQSHKDRQCGFRVTDAGFSPDKSVVILVRAKFFTALHADETEAEVPVARRCAGVEETWAFNYATGEIKQVSNAVPMLAFRKFLPNEPR